HPFFNGRTPSSQGGQQLSRSYGRRRSAGGSIRLGAFARRSQTDRQYGRGDMACNAESGRQSHFDVYTGHQRICYGAVVVTGGSHTLGNACCRKYLRHRSAIQCVLQDRVVSYRHVNRYVDHHDFLLADLVRGWLSETRGLPSRLKFDGSRYLKCDFLGLHLWHRHCPLDNEWGTYREGNLLARSPAFTEFLGFETEYTTP